MKKIIILMMLSVFSVSIFAAGTGTIDIQKVFFNYKEAKQMQDDFSKKEKAYKDKVEAKQEELEKYKDDPKKLKSMRDDIQDELEKERDRLLELNQQLTNQLKEKILVAIKKVARDYALDTVVDKQVVLYGGIDVTDWVVETLNKKK